MNWDDWAFDFEEGLKNARANKKPVLLQYHKDMCSGCKKLYAVTYPDPTVRQELFDWFAPVRLDILQNRRIRAKHNAVWTPSFYVLDYNGVVQDKFEGYLNPEDFRIMLRLALVSWLIPRGQYRKAIEILENAVDIFPDNPRTPQLLFRLGQALYLTERNNAEFREVMTEIRQRYPNSVEARMWPWMEEKNNKPGA